MQNNTKRPESILNFKPDTAFKQQRLKSWQPLLTPKSVIPVFFIIGLVFIPIGMVLKLASDNVVEVVLDYTLCDTVTNEFQAAPPETGINQWKYDTTTKQCSIQFQVPKVMNAPVYIYYRLTNFYQNNRKYVKSFDLKQLNGEALLDVATECDPLGKVTLPVDVMENNEIVKSSTGAVYYPCGLIANSLFSDLIEQKFTCIQSDFEFDNGGCKPNNSNTVFYQYSKDGISWPGDSAKYAKSKYSDMDNLTRMVIPPPFWMESFDEFRFGYNQTNFPNLKEWEDFQVWMRTAGLPTFRKLYGANRGSFLPKGTWQVNIKQNYDVSKFGGTKSLVITTASILGGKNPFLGFSYLVTGTICIILAVSFLIKHIVKPRTLGDHRLLSWNDQTKSERQ